MAPANENLEVRSVARAIDILIALGQSPLPLGDVSHVVRLSKPTTYRLITTLRSKGMVVQDQSTGQYGLGFACFHLMSSIANGNAGFIFESNESLAELRDATSETVAVHVRAGRSRICVKELSSPHSIRYIAGLGATEGIHVGSAGKVLLAFIPEAELERILKDNPLHADTPNTITKPDALRRELGRIAEVGVARSLSERVMGAVGVSAPILDSEGHALAALSVLGPADRLAGARLGEAEKLVKATAERVTATIARGAAQI